MHAADAGADFDIGADAGVVTEGGIGVSGALEAVSMAAVCTGEALVVVVVAAAVGGGGEGGGVAVDEARSTDADVSTWLPVRPAVLSPPSPLP